MPFNIQIIADIVGGIAGSILLLKAMSYLNELEDKNSRIYKGVITSYVVSRHGFILFVEFDGDKRGIEVTKEKFLSYPVGTEVWIKFSKSLNQITEISRYEFKQKQSRNRKRIY